MPPCIRGLGLISFSSHLETMLKHLRDLVLQREYRRGRKTIYAPRIRWATWLYSGGGEDEALPTSGRKVSRQGATEDGVDDDDESSSSDSKGSLLEVNKNGDLEKAAGLDVGQRKLAKSRKEVKMQGPKPSQQPKSLALRVRGHVADSLEWLQRSDDFLYAMKITIAVFLVVWPALITSWNKWYSFNRGRKSNFSIIECQQSIGY